MSVTQFIKNLNSCEFVLNLGTESYFSFEFAKTQIRN